jgi:hypothetical protein
MSHSRHQISLAYTRFSHVLSYFILLLPPILGFRQLSLDAYRLGGDMASDLWGFSGRRH